MLALRNVADPFVLTVLSRLLLYHPTDERLARALHLEDRFAGATPADPGNGAPKAEEVLDDAHPGAGPRQDNMLSRMFWGVNTDETNQVFAKTQLVRRIK